MGRAQDLFDRLVVGGDAEVRAFINEKVTEELFLDYKRSATNGVGSKLDQGDRNNLAKAVSGFGNSEGGVIIWGVDCAPDRLLGDVPSGSMPIENPTRFKSWLEQATSGVTVPPHTGVRHYAIPPDFVVTLISQGMHAPYQALPELNYYIRAGSNFVKAPHAVLAGMFGRRPEPSVKMHWLASKTPKFPQRGVLKTELAVLVRNFGRGMAHHPFCNVTLMSDPGSNCEVQFDHPADAAVWSGSFVLQRTLQVTMKQGFVLAPEQDSMAASLKITLREPIERDLIIDGLCGCSDGEPYCFQFKAEIADIIKASHQLLRISIDSVEAKSLLNRFNLSFYRQFEQAVSE